MTNPAAITLLTWDRLIGAGDRAQRAARTAFKAAGHPPLEWYDILAALDRHGAMRPRDLQARVGIEQYNLSRLLARMAARGMIAVADCPGDRRGQIVGLTPYGAGQRAAMWPTYAQAIIGAVETRLDPDQRIMLAGMLDKVA